MGTQEAETSAKPVTPATGSITSGGRAVLLLVVLGMFWLTTSISNGIYSALHNDAPRASSSLTYIFFFVLMCLWFELDRKKYGVQYPLDMGLLLYMVWPVVMAYHLFKTRGGKAWLLIAIIPGIYLLSLVVEVVTHVVASAVVEFAGVP